MTDETIRRYREAAEAHGEATKTGDASRANASHDIIASVYRELRASGQESCLLVLLDDTNVSVRAWAAAHALEFAPEVGEPVLSAVVEEDAGLVGFDAEMTLREWRAGRLRFP